MTTPTPDRGSEMSPEELERLRRRLAAPAPPDGVLDRARAAAMEAFDEAHAEAASVAAVRDIGSARAPRPAAWYQRVPLGAAAAIVAVVALVGVFSQIDMDGDDDTATADTDDSGDFGEAGAALDSVEGGDEELDDDSASRDALGGGSGGADDVSAGASAADGALVIYEDVDALVASLRTRYGATEPQAGEPAPSTTSTATAEFDRAECDAFAAAGLEQAVVLSQELVVLGTADDQAVAIVAVYDSDETGLRVAVVDEASCTLADDRAL